VINQRENGRQTALKDARDRPSESNRRFTFYPPSLYPSFLILHQHKPFSVD